MLKKIIVAILSSILFCLALAWFSYSPAKEGEPDVYHWTYWSLFMVYMIYAAPVYLLGGVPCAVLIDRLIGKLGDANKVIDYVRCLSAYMLAGLLTTYLFLVIISEGDLFVWTSPNRGFFGLGMGASVLYYHVLLVVNRIGRPTHPHLANE
ncbi:hypothetical protein [Brevibacillus migulae]|uniref:hypothetical protein n=1 Tax=Brevibacillus migulae TaxID=1644114 RepID=UPI00106EC66D|nr:hypothetical protein [Brevibacillus migulae]